MLDVLLVRHAHTYGNAQRHVWYSWETDRLDELWLTQIPHLEQKLAHRIRSLLHARKRKVIFHRSDTNRTRETLELSIRWLQGIDFELSAPHNDIGEIDMGDMTGKPLDKNLFQEVLTTTHNRFPNGECRKDVWNRMRRYLNSLEKDAIHVVFSHGVAISCAVHEIIWNYKQIIKLQNASISHLRINESDDSEIITIGE